MLSRMLWIKAFFFLPFSVIEKYADDVKNAVCNQRKVVFYFGRDEMRRTLENRSSIFVEAEEHGVANRYKKRRKTLFFNITFRRTNSFCDIIN